MDDEPLGEIRWDDAECVADAAVGPGYRAVSGSDQAVRYDLADRYLAFAARIIDLVGELPNTASGRHVCGQLLRCGTSPGANYEEASAAESRADFVHKMSIVLKELKESRYWLRLSLRAQLTAGSLIDPVLSECQELCAITAKSILTAKARLGSPAGRH